MKLMVILLGALLLHGSSVFGLPLAFDDLNTAPVLNIMEDLPLPHGPGEAGESYALSGQAGDWRSPDPGKTPPADTEIFELRAGCNMGIFLDPQAIWLLHSGPLPRRSRFFSRGFPLFPNGSTGFRFPKNDGETGSPPPFWVFFLNADYPFDINID